MRVKVYNGSAPSSERNLCDRCRHSTIIRGRALDEEIVRCDAGLQPLIIRFKVTTCSAHVDADAPSYAQLVRQAWILRPATPRRPAGFVRSTELSVSDFRSLMADAPDAFED
jgi:hypothetical protein